MYFIHNVYNVYSVDENAIANGTYKTYVTDYRARIPTNESIESNHSNKNKQQQQNTHNNNYRTVRSDKQPINVDNVSVYIYLFIHYECRLHVVKIVEQQ